MTPEQAQREAIRLGGDGVEFDLVTKNGRSRCRFEDVDLDVFTVLDRPKHLVGKTLMLSDLWDDDGFTVENVTAPKKVLSEVERFRVALRILAGRPDDAGQTHGSTLHDVPTMQRYAAAVLEGADPADVAGAIASVAAS